MILVGPARRAREGAADLAVAEAARGIRLDLVASGHARDLLAGEQDNVQDRCEEPDQSLDPAPGGELARCPMRHGARL